MSCCCADAASIAFERLEPRALFAAGALDVSIGTGAARSVRFVDADGTSVSVSISAAAATVHLTGDGLAQSQVGRDVVVSGAAIRISGVSATGTSRRSSVTVSSSGGDARVIIGNITADGPLKRLIAPGTVLTGPLSTGGPVTQLQVLRAENITITLGGGRGTSSVEVTEAAVDTTLTSAGALRRLTFGVWGGAAGPGGAVTAPSITKAIGGVFGGTLSLSAAGTLQFDRIENATVDTSGSVKRLFGRVASNSIVNVGGDIGDATFGTLVRTRVYAGVRPLPPQSPIPTSVADFAAPSTLRRLYIGDVDDSSEVVVAARFMRSVFLGFVSPEANITTHIVADRVTDVRGTIHYTHARQPFHFRRLESEVRQPGDVEVRAL